MSLINTDFTTMYTDTDEIHRRCDGHTMQLDCFFLRKGKNVQDLSAELYYD